MALASGMSSETTQSFVFIDKDTLHASSFLLRHVSLRQDFCMECAMTFVLKDMLLSSGIPCHVHFCRRPLLIVCGKASYVCAAMDADSLVGSLATFLVSVLTRSMNMLLAMAIRLSNVR